jgi:hypothetical protein
MYLKEWPFPVLNELDGGSREKAWPKKLEG